MTYKQGIKGNELKSHALQILSQTQFQSLRDQDATYNVNM